MERPLPSFLPSPKLLWAALLCGAALGGSLLRFHARSAAFQPESALRPIANPPALLRVEDPAPARFETAPPSSASGNNAVTFAASDGLPPATDSASTRLANQDAYQADPSLTLTIPHLGAANSEPQLPVDPPQTSASQQPDTTAPDSPPPPPPQASSPAPEIDAEYEKLPFGPSWPSHELTAAARQADALITSGVGLAERGATFSARSTFISALRLLAAELDYQRSTNAHALALAAGLKALEEAEDFQPRGGQIADRAILADIVSGHRTSVLARLADDKCTPGEALQTYLTYAQEQLAAAGGDLAPAASALYNLGKLETTAASVAPSPVGLAQSRAVVFFQAALFISPRHSAAANELGVVLARHGKMLPAKQSFLHSLSCEPHAATWRNLAIVHRELDEPELAARAEQESRRLVALRPTGVRPNHSVQWIDPQTFARTNRAEFDGAPHPANPNGSRPSPVPTPAVPARSASSWFPWSTKNR